MPTEDISPRYVDLDSWSSIEMIEAMYEGQLAAAGAVRGALKAIAAAVDDAVPALQRGGGSSMRGPEHPGGSVCRTAPSCRRPMTGRPIGWSSPWRAGCDRAAAERRGRRGRAKPTASRRRRRQDRRR